MMPGAPDAALLGCCCPRVENSFGLGTQPLVPSHNYYLVNPACSLHGISKWTLPIPSGFNDAGNVTTLVYGKSGIK